MTISYRVVLPVVDEAMSDGCVASLHPEVRANTLIVDNSLTGFAQKYEQLGCRVIGWGANIGVAASWNLGAVEVLDHGDDYLIALSAQMKYGEPGMLDLIDLLDERRPEAMLARPGYWHNVAWSRRIFETVGLPDETFMPAYYEDTDFGYRMTLAGFRFADGEIDAVARRDGHGYDALREQHPGQSVINFDALRLYYKAKWGGLPGEETFRWPFNNPRRHLSWWPDADRAELKRRYGIV